ncbi:hypothetical protein SAY87_004785 [Trapa incisa]|uniref:Uncharacterized protein n=1 Tax=Trapa incisa TaxID=236973 RepID=A0AAN7JQE9_9MYRT|nr:hypothetical protein SAY87_004785 [Trapa incisa]
MGTVTVARDTVTHVILHTYEGRLRETIYNASCSPTPFVLNKSGSATSAPRGPLPLVFLCGWVVKAANHLPKPDMNLYTIKFPAAGSSATQMTFLRRLITCSNPTAPNQNYHLSQLLRVPYPYTAPNNTSLQH